MIPPKSTVDGEPATGSATDRREATQGGAPAERQIDGGGALTALRAAADALRGMHRYWQKWPEFVPNTGSDAHYAGACEAVKRMNAAVAQMTTKQVADAQIETRTEPRAEPPPAAAPAHTSERQAFEWWLVKRHITVPQRSPWSDEYPDPVQAMWEGWQARAAPVVAAAPDSLDRGTVADRSPGSDSQHDEEA